MRVSVFEAGDSTYEVQIAALPSRLPRVVLRRQGPLGGFHEIGRYLWTGGGVVCDAGRRDLPRDVVRALLEVVQTEIQP